MIVLISGCPGAGKTTISRMLGQHFKKSIHIPVDNLREMVVSGMASVDPWTAATTEQFNLARQSAAFMATEYERAGFVVVLDDVVFPNDTSFDAVAQFKILLRPRLEVLLHRNATRSNKDFDANMLIPVIQGIHSELSKVKPEMHADWFFIDSSNFSAEEVLQKILEETK